MMTLEQLKPAVEFLAVKDEMNDSEQKIFARIATAEQIESLVRQLRDLNEAQGQTIDALEFVGISTTQATPKQVLDLIEQIEDKRAQSAQKNAA